MDNREALNNIIEIMDYIKKTDNEIIKISDNLKIILLNLRIENVRIKQNTGIVPIIDALGKSIDSIENSVKNLISNNREKFSDSIEELSKHIEEGE